MSNVKNLLKNWKQNKGNGDKNKIETTDLRKEKINVGDKEDNLPIINADTVKKQSEGYNLVCEFVNLHHHDEYSLRSALGNNKEAIKLVKKYNQTHYAVTNYGEVTGWVNQYFTCIDNGVVPILGIEAFVTNYRISYTNEKNKDIYDVEYFGADKYWKKPKKELSPDEKSEVPIANHLLLYARNMDGYFNIIKCHNDAQLNGFNKKPRMTDKMLSEHGNGIFCIMPCLTGEISGLLDAGEEERAKKKCDLYMNIFDRFYLELLIMEDEQYIEYNENIIKFAQKYNIPMVVGINSHYLNTEDSGAFEILMAMKSKAVSSYDNNVDIVKDMSYKSYEEVCDIFERFYKNDVFTQTVFDECVNNVRDFCSAINTLPIDTTPKLPKFKNAHEAIRQKALEGMRQKGLLDKQEYMDRLEYELDNIIRAGFADYFLFLEDIVVWCRENNVLVGSGRGCFTPFSRVRMADGFYKFIGDINIGDKVISGEGNKKEVEAVFEYDIDEEIVDIELEDGRIISCTIDHKIKVLRDNKKQWIKAIEIKETDYIVEITDI